MLIREVLCKSGARTGEPEAAVAVTPAEGEGAMLRCGEGERRVMRRG
jgi:hypothetical protein